jgi:hypothetical protein
MGKLPFYRKRASKKIHPDCLHVPRSWDDDAELHVRNCGHVAVIYERYVHHFRISIGMDRSAFAEKQRHTLNAPLLHIFGKGFVAVIGPHNDPPDIQLRIAVVGNSREKCTLWQLQATGVASNPVLLRERTGTQAMGILMPCFLSGGGISHLDVRPLFTLFLCFAHKAFSFNIILKMRISCLCGKNGYGGL